MMLYPNNKTNIIC